MNNNKNKFSLNGFMLLIGIWVAGLSSCEKWVENNPARTQLLDDQVYTDSTTVKAALLGVYNKMSSGNRYSLLMSTRSGFSADELTFVGNTYEQFVGNAIIPTNADVDNLWAGSYSVIYDVNAIIEGTEAGSNLTERFKLQTIAEARFVRAFCYFYLINLFGDVPLVLTTEVERNRLSARESTAKVYEQIIDDLLFAQTGLPDDYSFSAGARVRANQWAATALLARVYLYLGKWQEAERQASMVLDKQDLFKLEEDLEKVFAPDSKEAILQFYNDLTGRTSYAVEILPNPAVPVPKYVFTDVLKTAFDTNVSDKRHSWYATLDYNGTVYSYPAKYRSLVQGANEEYFTLFRLAEQYLIRAEARIQLNDLDNAREDITALRSRAGLGAAAAEGKEEFLLVLEKERQLELSNEMGHRWFDLKRTGRIDELLSKSKPGWISEAALYPVPANQRARNRNLSQNLGYN